MKATKNKTSITISSSNEDIIKGFTIAAKELNMSFDELADALKKANEVKSTRRRGGSKV